ncbi:MAG: alanine--glyoxylate aminotransferase family protein [Lachnospiraceae bacterium]|jgi:aspartate aminotransferase-like enzyme|nr:alanine--glyoxylate aminotransferase family protein [Lachnospiraceae bacterium]MCI1328421.1 alanine--glyoxylate aminotransferase family protein [Lachnospiraceae bacterium]
MKKDILLLAGPTALPEREIKAMDRQVIYHRSEEFEQITKELNANLKKVFKTKEDVMVLTGSGTAAMEAAIQNCFSAGDEVIVVVLGVFSERMAEMAETFGLNVIRVVKAPGEAASVEEVMAKMTERTKGVFVIHNESATGVTSDVQAFGEALKDTGALLVVDTVSGLGALEFEFDAWHVDVAFASSQKALMGAPGTAVICLSEKAWKAAETSTLPTYYLDLKKARAFGVNGQHPWTPAIYSVIGLNESVRMIVEEGIDEVIARNTRLSRMVTEGLEKMGLKRFAKDPSYASKSVNTFFYEKASQFVEKLAEEYGIQIYNGQADLYDTTFRVGTMGYVAETDIAAFLYAAERVIKELEE